MNDRKKIAFHTLGCKLNFAETSTISRDIDRDKFEIVDFREHADYYVINTCLVTATAEKKCLYAIRHAHKLNPEAGIAVVGCYSQLKPEKLEAIEGVRLILGNTEKFNLAKYLEETSDLRLQTSDFRPQISDLIPHTSDNRKDMSFHPSFSAGDRTRSFLKIQDGCDYFCSYCIIPIARGRSRSALIKGVIANAEEIAKEGIKEIVLTGVNIGDFGKGNDETFFQLIKELEKVNGVERFRISSIEPDLLKDEIIEFVAKSGKFLPHFHLPLQSGSNKILKLMHRKYDTQLFKSRVEKIKELMPHCLIAADVILGFPGETDEDYEDTYNFIKDTDITYTHIFPYSERENTYSAKMTDKVPRQKIKERCHKLQMLSDRKKKDFYFQNKGSTRKVLFESDNDNGFMTGFTENYIKVKTNFNDNLINKIVEVKLENMDKDGTYVL
jgi:threonylcarbamoyladenosine tRNA methylthiotransferase MtaB